MPNEKKISVEDINRGVAHLSIHIQRMKVETQWLEAMRDAWARDAMGAFDPLTDMIMAATPENIQKVVTAYKKNKFLGIHT